MLSARAGRWPRTEWRSCCEADDAAGTRGATARHRGAALSPAAPVPRAAARRQMHEGPSPGLGAQPLLLPGDDPGEGREPDPALRREWRRRLVDHDGESEGDGGIARWLKLTDGVGLDRDYVVSLAGLLPATRFAVEAYVHFVRDKTLLEAVASSLTELFSSQIISERLEGMLKSYDFVSADTLAYFSKRPPLAQRDSDFALDYVKREAKTPDAQQAVLKALEFKCDVLWAMLDALYHAYVAPKHVPPGAFVPQDWRSA